MSRAVHHRPHQLGAVEGHAARVAVGEIRAGEVWLVNSNIPEFSHGNRFNHVPKRERKLLLHRREIDKLDEASARDGYTLLPLEIYLKGGRVKVNVGVCRGKKQHDKRQVEKERDWQREQAQLMRRKA